MCIVHSTLRDATSLYTRPLTFIQKRQTQEMKQKYQSEQ